MLKSEFCPSGVCVENRVVLLKMHEVNAYLGPLLESGFQALVDWGALRIVYGGGGLWREEEDVYNPVRDAPRVIKAWREAGGRCETREQVAMKHRA